MSAEFDNWSTWVRIVYGEQRLSAVPWEPFTVDVENCAPPLSCGSLALNGGERKRKIWDSRLRCFCVVSAYVGKCLDFRFSISTFKGPPPQLIPGPFPFKRIELGACSRLEMLVARALPPVEKQIGSLYCTSDMPSCPSWPSRGQVSPHQTRQITFPAPNYLHNLQPCPIGMCRVQFPALLLKRKIIKTNESLSEIKQNPLGTVFSKCSLISGGKQWGRAGNEFAPEDAKSPHPPCPRDSDFLSENSCVILTF